MKKKPNTVESINERALEMIGKGNFYTAQEIFKQNAKKNPCFISLNNLGVFYICEGMQLSNGKVYNARKLGLRYLKLAETFLQTQENLMAIGEVYFNIKEYKTASDYFCRACKLNNSFINLNNLGVSLYMQCEYEDAAKCFKKALDNCNDSYYSDTYPAKSSILSSYAFSLIQYNKKECHSVLGKMIYSNICNIEIDEFIIAYFCGDFQLAKGLIKNMFKSWKLDTSVIAMVFDCLIRLKKNDEAEEYLKYQIEILEGYEYDISKEIKCAKRALYNLDYREKAIAKYLYTPPVLKQSYYIYNTQTQGTV